MTIYQTLKLNISQRLAIILVIFSISTYSTANAFEQNQELEQKQALEQNQGLEQIIIDKQSKKIHALETKITRLKTHYEDLLSTLRNNGILSKNQLKKLSTNRFMTEYGENVTTFESDDATKTQYNHSTRTPHRSTGNADHHQQELHAPYSQSTEQNINEPPKQHHNDNHNDILSPLSSVDYDAANDADAPIEQDKSLYEMALASLKGGDLKLAEEQFEQFMNKHPNSKWKSNASFWYAETFYRRGLFNKAAVHYLQSYKKFPKGAKASQSLLKLSYSLASINKMVDACKILDKLEKEFKHSALSSIQRAKDAKIKFQCPTTYNQHDLT